GYDMFNAMLDGIKEESVGYLFNLEVEVDDQPATPTVGAQPVSVAKSAPATGAEEDTAPADDVEEAAEAPAIKAKGLEKPSRPKKLDYTAPTIDGEGGVEHHTEETKNEFAGVNRNDPCPCGSGKKYKRCHGDPRNRNKETAGRQAERRSGLPDTGRPLPHCRRRAPRGASPVVRGGRASRGMGRRLQGGAAPAAPGVVQAQGEGVDPARDDHDRGRLGRRGRGALQAGGQDLRRGDPCAAPGSRRPEAGHLAADGRRRDQGQVRGGAGAREDLGDEPDGRVRDGADLRVHPVRRSYEAQAGRADRGRGGRSERQGSMGGGTGLGRRPVPDEADGGGAGWRRGGGPRGPRRGAGRPRPRRRGPPRPSRPPVVRGAGRAGGPGAGRAVGAPGLHGWRYRPGAPPGTG